MHTVEVRGTHEGNVDTQVTMVGGAVQAEIDTERHRRPSGILRATIEAYLCSQTNCQRIAAPQTQRGGVSFAHLVSGLEFEFLKDLLRLRLGGTHDDKRGRVKTRTKGKGPSRRQEGEGGRKRIQNASGRANVVGIGLDPAAGFAVETCIFQPVALSC